MRQLRLQLLLILFSLFQVITVSCGGGGGHGSCRVGLVSFHFLNMCILKLKWERFEYGIFILKLFLNLRLQCTLGKAMNNSPLKQQALICCRCWYFLRYCLYWGLQCQTTFLEENREIQVHSLQITQQSGPRQFLVSPVLETALGSKET